MKSRELKSRAPTKKIAGSFFVALFWIATWLLLAKLVDKELLLPYPHTVLLKLGQLCMTLLFWEYVALTLMRILLGIFFGVILGTLLAIVTCRFSFMHRLIYPLITIIRATPVASFIILVLIWLGSGQLPIFICVLMVLPIVWAAVSDGIRSLDEKLAEVCHIYRFSFLKRVRLFYIPAILPYFLSACKTSIGMAWKAGVAAEVLTVPAVSIGKMLYESKLYWETLDLFAWTLVVIICSLIIEKVLISALTVLGKSWAKGGISK